MALEHLLITRFSVRWDEGASAPDDEWLRERVAIFRRYTLPSVLGQTQPPDAWVLLCSPRPQWLRDEFAAMQEEAAWIRPVETDEHFSPALVRDVVKDALPPGADRILTTRIDNDDVIAEDYLAAVRAEAGDDYEGFINFTKGLQLADRKLYWRSDPLNPFISLAEPVGELRTVFVDWHNHLDRYGPVRQVSTRPMWIQVVHGGNLANRASGIRVDPSKVASTFAADLDLCEDTAVALRIDQARSALTLIGRVIRRPKQLLWILRVLRPGSTPQGG